MAGVFDEKWMKWVALTTTVLAVCTAIASLKGGGFSTQVQLLTTKENNQWSYFQSKSIKEHMLSMQRDSFFVHSLEAGNADAKKAIDSKLKEYDADLIRYKKEKEDIKSEAEKITVQEDMLKRHGSNFGIAVMFLQIAIMLSSVGALLKKKELWVVGLLIGLVGLFYAANGFFWWVS